jgi:glucose/mannose transport system substrate-binding protein
MRIRHVLASTLALGLLPGSCATEETIEPAADGGETEAPADDAEGPAGTSSVEVFSWWTAGGEADGLEAMIEVFNDRFPEYTFENAAIAGGAGTAARAVVASRLAAGDPPSSWQGSST